MRRAAILQCIVRDQKKLEQRGVKSLSLFGSVARGEEKKTSDVDILVSFSRPVGLFAFMELKNHLEGVLGMPVDLVTKQALHPHLRARILKESIHAL